MYRRIRYALTENEWGYAWLLEPESAAKPRAAVIALHQTVIQGKDEASGIEGRGTEPRMPLKGQADPASSISREVWIPGVGFSWPAPAEPMGSSA